MLGIFLFQLELLLKGTVPVTLFLYYQDLLHIISWIIKNLIIAIASFIISVILNKYVTNKRAGK